MELCRGDGGGGALRGLICGAMPDHGLAGVSMRGGSDGYEHSVIWEFPGSQAPGRIWGGEWGGWDGRDRGCP